MDDDVPQAEHEAWLAHHARLQAAYARDVAACRRVLQRLDHLRDSYHQTLDEIEQAERRADRDVTLPSTAHLRLGDP